MPKHGLRASDVAERSCNSYKLIMVARQKVNKGKKLLDTTLRKYSTRMKLILYLKIISLNLKGYLICWINMVFHSMKIIWLSIY